jgi:hypothetical protein
VGSGAFALGMLNEIVRARYSLNPSMFGQLDGIDGRSLYDLKWHTIENTIYGVDLDPGAVEIAKLRLWLSLIVDEERIDTVNPLPNLDYKIMQGNSLLETFEGTKLFDESAVARASRKRSGQMSLGAWAEKPKEQLDLELGGRNHLVNEFRRVQHHYFKASHKSEKEKLRKKLEQVEDRLIETTLSEQKKSDALALLTKYRQSHFKPYFLWRLNFNEVFSDSTGFDIIIANPPYGANLEANDVPQYLGEYPNSTKGVRDLYKMFIELGINKLACENGTVCFILPNTFLTQSKYKDVRKLLLENRIDEIVNLGDGAFNQVVVPTCIIRVAVNSEVRTVKYFDIRSQESFGDFSLDAVPVEIPRESICSSKELLIVPSNRVTASNEVTLGDVAECRDAGIQYAAPGVGRLNKGEAKLGERLLYSGAKPEHSGDIPLLVGGDISRWQVENSPSHYLRHNYKSLLKKGNGEWFHYTAHIFDSAPRILWRQTSDRIIACEDCSKYWFKKSLHGAIIKETYATKIPLRYLLGLLNSSYLNWLYIQMSQETGRIFPQVKITKMKQLPIRIGSNQIVSSIVKVVDHIIELLQSTPRAKLSTSALEKLLSAEKQLDQLVFELYEIDTTQIESIREFFDKQTLASTE